MKAVLAINLQLAFGRVRGKCFEVMQEDFVSKRISWAQNPTFVLNFANISNGNQRKYGLCIDIILCD